MEEVNKERTEKLTNIIEMLILKSLIGFGKTRPEESLSAISVAANNIIFSIASTATNSRKKGIDIVITILDKQKELYLKQAKKEGYDLENL